MYVNFEEHAFFHEIGSFSSTVHHLPEELRLRQWHLNVVRVTQEETTTSERPSDQNKYDKNKSRPVNIFLTA